MNEKQKPVTEKYKSNWDMIFGKKTTNVNDLLTKAQDLESKYKAGKLSAKEFKELVGDLRILQKVLEKLLSGSFGKWTEKTLKNWQLPKIRKEPFIVVEDDELSFHPDSKQKVLLEKFLNYSAPLSSTINIVV